MKTPIALISGYLGAGKTTLLKNVIKNLDRKFAILMNEFGEVSIDTQIVKGKNVDIQELIDGCVCCSLTGEFEKALKEIIEKYSPEIIIVETTGVAEADAIVFDIQEELPFVSLDTNIVVVDADALATFPRIGKVAETQIAVGDVILLNKIDLVKKGKLKKIENDLKSINEKAYIFRTKNCDIDIDLLFSLEVEHHVEGRHHILGGGSQRGKTLGNHIKMESFVLDTEKDFTKDELEKFLETLPNAIYRVKGFVKINGKNVLVNYVGKRWTLEESPGENKLVFIGNEISNLKNSLL